MNTTVVIYDQTGTKFTVSSFPSSMTEAIAKTTEGKLWATLPDFALRNQVDSIDPNTFTPGSAAPLK